MLKVPVAFMLVVLEINSSLLISKYCALSMFLILRIGKANVMGNDIVTDFQEICSLPRNMFPKLIQKKNDTNGNPVIYLCINFPFKFQVLERKKQKKTA